MPGEHTAISNEFMLRLRCSKFLTISIWGDEPTRMPADVLGAAILLDKANLSATLIPTVIAEISAIPMKRERIT